MIDPDEIVEHLILNQGWERADSEDRCCVRSTDVHGAFVYTSIGVAETGVCISSYTKYLLDGSPDRRDRRSLEKVVSAFFREVTGFDIDECACDKNGVNLTLFFEQDPSSDEDQTAEAVDSFTQEAFQLEYVLANIIAIMADQPEFFYPHLDKETAWAHLQKRVWVFQPVFVT
jgi:hypothetical protein